MWIALFKSCGIMLKDLDRKIAKIFLNTFTKIPLKTVVWDRLTLASVVTFLRHRCQLTLQIYNTLLDNALVPTCFHHYLFQYCAIVSIKLDDILHMKCLWRGDLSLSLYWEASCRRFEWNTKERQACPCTNRIGILSKLLRLPYHASFMFSSLQKQKYCYILP